jgi:hypothetical protein
MHLEFVDELAGPILDVAQDRILYVDYSGEAPRVTIKDRADGSETVLGEGPVSTGSLAPGGAIYVQAPGGGAGSLVQYAEGMPTDLGMVNSDYSLQTAGRWAIWNRYTATFDTPLVVRDLISGQQRVVAEDAGNWQNDVAENGDIVFWDNQYNVIRDRDGELEVLSSANATTWVTYPRTDGINVIYRKTSICCADEDGGIWLTTESGEIDLDAFRTEWPNADTDYAVNDGWAAFTRPRVGGGFGVWSRDPDGLIEPRDTTVNAQIGTMGSDGHILIRERASDGQRLFLSRAGEETIPLGSVEGTLTGTWAIGTDWYVASATFTPDPDTGLSKPGPASLYIVAAGAAPTPTPTPTDAPTAPAPTASGPSSMPIDITPPPTDAARLSRLGSPSGAVLVLLGLVILPLLVTACRARSIRRRS